MTTEGPLPSHSFIITRLSAPRYPDVASIAALLEDEPLDAATLADRDRRGAAVNLRLVAEESGRAIGYAHIERFAYFDPGDVAVSVAIAPGARNAGHGGSLLEVAETLAISHGAKSLVASIHDADEDTRRFVENRGYRIANHSYSSELYLGDFVAPDVETPAGVRIESFADTDRSEAAMRRLFEINERGSDLVPDQGRPFDQFRKDVFEAAWFRPEGQILAVAEGEYVGIAAVGEVAPGHFYHMNTGVLPEFRGRGIATCLKLHAIEAARRMGGRIVTTHNDSRNEPMLAINRKLGYIPRPGRFHLRKPVEVASLC